MKDSRFYTLLGVFSLFLGSLYLYTELKDGEGMSNEQWLIPIMFIVGGYYLLISVPGKEDKI